MNISEIAQIVGKFAVDKSPTILTAAGVVGVVSTAVMTGKSSYKAAQYLADEPPFHVMSRDEKKAAVKRVYPLFIAPVIVGGMTISCIIFANHIGVRRATALAAAYSVTEKAFEKYREKIVEEIGESKEVGVRDAIAQERVTATPVGKSEVIITGGGEVLCFDTYTGRYFHSSMETLKQAQNNLNYRLLHDFSASLNDFYDLIGLDQVSSGDDVGWNSDRLMELEFSTTISEDQRPCIAITFHVTPTLGYFRTH